jgi:hypothetical protein
MHPRPSFHLSIAVLLSFTSLAAAQAQATASAATSPPAYLLPLGPAIEPHSITPAALNAAVHPIGKTFLISYPADDKRPQALLVFPTMDLSKRLGLAVEINNPGSGALRIYGELNRNMWSRDYVLIPAKATRTLYIFVQRTGFTPPDEALDFQGMKGIPGGQMQLWPEAEIDASAVTSVGLILVAPRHPASIEVESIQPFGTAIAPDHATLASSYLPFIDRFGQLIHKEWPGKVHTDAELTSAVAAERADLDSHPRPADWDNYGGWASGPTLRASGHFRTEKYQGKWWLVDPDGHLFWSQGVDVVMDHERTEVEARHAYFAAPAPNGDFLARNLEIKYGADWQAAWTSRMTERLPSWGYNTVGSFSGPSVPATHKVPYVYFFHSRGKHNFLDPDVPARLADLRAQMVAAAGINSDPWCLGFFVDNEIHETDPAWWKDYYSSVSALAKELLPNKLYLGSRLDFHDWPDSSAERYAIVRLAAQYTDVISFNQYRYTFEDFKLPPDIDKPVIVGEFHFGALDRGLLHTGLRSVIDQDQRADAYTHFMETALENPNLVGAHWFELYDEPTTGRGDGENYQIGLLDICDQPYAETIAAARHVAAEMYTLRIKAK